MWRCLVSAFALILMINTAYAGSPRASSTLVDGQGVRHSASLAFDGLLKTGWAEGVSASGAGSWLELPFDRITEVHSLSIWPGDLSQGVRTLREHGRPHTVRVDVDVYDGEDLSISVRIVDPAETGPQRVDVRLEAPVRARSIRITIEEAYVGGIYSDTYISEVAVNFLGKDSAKELSNVEKWLESADGKRALDRNHSEVVGLYEKIEAEEFGDRDSLHVLMDRAADGAPFLRSYVRRRVSAGFRIQALSADTSSIDALRKLKDSNAIPSIQLAAVRSSGKAEGYYERLAEYFGAYQDLIGGGPTAAAWGQEGFQKGALQSFGEPLPVEIDGFGGIFVADVGNHRIQRFNFQGIVEKVYGHPEPGITDVWFHQGRKYYPAGSAPGEGAGQFSNPLDIAILPNRNGDEIWTLDGLGKVRKIGTDGEVSLVAELDVEELLSPGVGGEGYLVFAKNKFAAIWGNEVFVLDEKGEQIGTFDLTDGVPNCAVGFKNGKIGLGFGASLVEYSMDGFRHGDLLGDTLGDGFEYWDVALDESNKLWAVTDTGWVVQYKRPGKVEFRVKFVDYSLQKPRFDVYDGLLFITDRDTILRVDALEVHGRSLLAAEASENEESAP